MRKHLELKAWILLTVFLTDIVISTKLLALGSGPSQPEMAAFTPAGTTEMVDPFTGDFSYNIPLMDVEGYPVNIAYSSGVTMEQEASWVGLGWNLNVGTVNRSVRGLPDDFKGDEIESTTYMEDMVITKVGGNIGVEVFGKEGLAEIVNGNASLGLSFIRNSYKGFGIELGASMGPSLDLGPLRGSGSVGFTLNSLDGASFNSSLSASITTTEDANKLGGSFGKSRSSGFSTRTGQKYLSFGTTAGFSVVSHNDKKGDDLKKGQGGNGLGSSTTYLPIGIESYTPYPSVEMESNTETYSGSVGGQIFGVNSNVSLHGSKTTQSIKQNTITSNAYGYLYTENANNKDLLDFNRDKPTILNKTVQNLPPTSFTYDVYSVSGQGVSGMFRPFRNDIGMVHDPQIGGKNGKTSDLGAEYGLGSYFKGGINTNSVKVYGEYGEWKGGGHSAYQFKGNEINSLYEKVYFKAAGDMAESDIDYFNNELGGTEAVAFELSGMTTLPNLIDEDGYSLSTVFPTLPEVKRKARSKHLGFLTAQDASDYYGNTVIKSYNGNYTNLTAQPHSTDDVQRIDNNRKAHHIAEIVQTNPDGERYVFGIAAYNLSKKELSFRTDDPEPNDNNGKVVLDPQQGLITVYPYDFHDANVQTPVSFGRLEPSNALELGSNNSAGVDGYYSEKEVPAYAHSYLLTEKQSANYQDVTGDGPSMDDAGNAWQFNYTRTSDNYGWRVPYTNFTMDKGFTSDNNDQQASSSSGTKEMWYLHTVESKNLVAEFKISPRNDALAANLGPGQEILFPYGGRPLIPLGQSTYPDDQRSYQLDQIVLYNKYDRTQNGDAAVPIKTIEFTYDYSLCKGIENQVDRTEGKLTLRKIETWYGNNTAEKESPYHFKYSGEDIDGDGNIDGINPNYHPLHVDRWGNYKNPAVNPTHSGNTMENNDFPYVVQESANPLFDPDNWASAWNLRQITTPAGGKITVDYESDEYAYVQDKRAMQMFEVIGISDNNVTDVGQINSRLYDKNPGVLSGYTHRHRIYIKKPVDVPTNLSQAELKELFFGRNAELSNMYFRFKTNINATEFDYVSGYITASSINYSDDGDPNTEGDKNYLYIDLVGNRNPITTTSWSFFRQNLFEILYEQPNVDNDDVEALIKGIKANIRDIQQMFMKVAPYLESRQIADEFVPAHSFVRLYEPTNSKLGGGSRVSRIEMNDDWSQMSDDTNPQDATYGQDYEYTTTDEDGNTISSGVATYEPLLGNDENPFRQPVSYVAQGASGHIPAIDDYQETPFGETFFPGASVGYSKVKVTNIHKNNGNTSNLITENNFYTAKDFPVIVRQTNLSGRQRHHSPTRGKKMSFPFKNQTNRSEFAASQGYSIILNDMHGKPSIIESYTLHEVDGSIVKKVVAGSKTNYRHKTTEHGLELDNEVQVVSADGAVNNKLIGVEYDVTIDSQNSYDETSTSTVKANLDVLPSPWAIPWIIPMVYFNTIKDIKESKAVVVTKTIQMYGLVESVENYTDQYATTTYNQLYDGTTGQVLLTKSQDEHKTDEYQLTVPAYLTPNLQRMGPASENAFYEEELVIEDGNNNCYDVDPSNNNTGTSFRNLKGIFKHGDEVMVYPKNGSTPFKAWVDVNFNSFINNTPNGKDPFINMKGDDCVEREWSVNLYYHAPISGVSGTDHCISVSTNPPGSINAISLNYIPGEVEVFLPNQALTNSFLNPDDNGAVNPTQQDYFDAFCATYNLTGNVFNQWGTYSYGIFNTNQLDIPNLFPQSVTANAIYDGLGLNVNLTFKESEVEGNTNLKNLLTNTSPWDLAGIFLIKTKIDYNGQIQDFYRLMPYQVDGVYYSIKGVDVTVNPTIIETVAINPTINGSPCPISFRLLSQNGAYLTGLENGDKIKIMRSGKRNMLAANEGLVVANDNPANIIAGKFKGVKDPADINIVQMSSQEFSDDYDVDDNYEELSTNKFLTASDGNFKVVRTHRFNGKRYQDDLQVETAKDGYLESPPISWTAFDDDCYFLINSPLQTNDASWLLQEEILSFHQSGASVEAKNALDLHSSVRVNPTGKVEAVAANTEKSEFMVESFENYKHLYQARFWENPYPWLSNFGNSTNNALELNYLENDLIADHEEVLVKGVAHTGDYSIFLKGDIPIGQTDINYTVKPLSSLVNQTVGNINGNEIQTLLATNIPDPLQLEDDLVNSVPSLSDVQTELTNATSGTANRGNGLFELTYSDIPGTTNNDWRPEEGESYYFTVWVKEILPSDAGYKRISPKVTIRITSNQTGGQDVSTDYDGVNAKEINGWYQIQGTFSIPSTSNNSENFETHITLKGGLWGAFFDDLRIHPVESNVQSYVYNLQNGRLKAQLDENNYATFYDYNDEGILSQVRKETASGVLTISESRQSKRNHPNP